MRRAYAWVLIATMGCADGDAEPATEASSTSGVASTSANASSTTAPMPTETSEGSTSADASSSTSGGVDPTTGDPQRCAPAPDADAPWLRDYVDEVVARLTGQAELTPGVTVNERASTASRAATADWLEAEFTTLGLDVQRHAYSASGTNIVGRLPATEPGGRTVVIGAHFDSVPGSPGANDNATGVAFVLSLARYLGSIECRSHDVLFVGFDEEEIGLVGSDAFAAALVDAGEDVLAVHTIDQMGWDNDGDRAIELERADEGLFEFYEAASASLDVPITLHPTGTGFTDHVSFRAYGFPAIGLTEEFVNGDTTPHYHLPGDTYDTVNFDLLVSTCVLGHTAFASLIDAG